MTTSGANMDLADIQGDILRAYGNDYDCTSYVFVNIDAARAGRAWSPACSTRSRPPSRGQGQAATTLNVAVTAAGLRALGVSEDVVDTFSREFREGMAPRATLLGDVGPSAPQEWEPGLGTGEAHVC